MRFISDFTIETTKYIKKCVEWKINDDFEAEKRYLSNFINFVKFRIFSKNKITKQVFEDFEMTPDDEQLKGMFQVCLEIVLSEKEDLEIDIKKILRTIKKIEQKHVAKKQTILEPEKTIKKEVRQKESPAVATEEIEKQKILIYWEFDSASDFALEYGIRFAKELKAEISLVHFATKGRDHILGIKKLREIVQNVYSKDGIRLNAKIKEKVKDFAEMTKATENINADFAIMGVSEATKKLNLIHYSDIPVLVVQTSPREEVFGKIVFPIDRRKEIKSKLNFVKALSKLYKSKYYVCLPKKISPEIIRKQTENNLHYVESYLRQTSIENETVIIDTKSNTEAAYKCANQINADLILILPHEKANFSGYVLSGEEKTILKNSPNTAILFTTSNKKHGTFGTGVMY